MLAEMRAVQPATLSELGNSTTRALQVRKSGRALPHGAAATGL
jgi:hypothetical protein